MTYPAKLLRFFATILLVSGSALVPPAFAQPPEGTSDPLVRERVILCGAWRPTCGRHEYRCGTSGCVRCELAACDRRRSRSTRASALRVNPPKTPTEFAETLDWMARIGRWDEVSRYIAALQKSNWNQNQLAELSIAGGADLWFKLRDATTELKEPQRELFAWWRDCLPSYRAIHNGWMVGLFAWLPRLQAKARSATEIDARWSIRHRTFVHACTGRASACTRRILLADALLEFQPDGVEAFASRGMTHDAAARGRVYLAIASSRHRILVARGCRSCKTINYRRQARGSH